MRQSSMSRNRKRQRGAVLVEYALLLTFFALPVMAGFTAAGVALLNNYRQTRATILQPFP
jgi:Flp pilus assembly pilin Flp